jgi:hypothetical protein
MNKTVKWLLIFLAFDLVVVVAYFGVTSLGKGAGTSPQDEFSWITVDEAYVPHNAVEQFVKDDAAQKGLLPILIKDYGKSAAVLKRFKGTRFAGANTTVLEMSFPGLDDWMIIDIKYQNENERQVARTILYVEINGQWQVGDSGSLMK